MARKIFISYRRDDAKADARSIYQHFAQAFGAGNIFMDVDSIQKGLDFTQVLNQSLRDTALMLVVIGRTWLTHQDERGRRRLDDPADLVRLEIATALKFGIPIIPVRVDGARMPHADELPEELQALTRRQGTIVGHDNFDSDIRGLESDARKLIGGPEKPRRVPIALAAGITIAAAAGAGAYLWSRQSSAPMATVVPPPTSVQPGSAKSAAKASRPDPVRAAAAWATAKQKGTFLAYRDYLRAFPQGDHRKEATDAAIERLREQLRGLLEARMETLKGPSGQPPGYFRLGNPRSFAACIDWSGTSHETLTLVGWGSYAGGSGYTGPADEIDKRSMAFCTNPRKDTDRCVCEISHRDGTMVLHPPQDWVARQLR